MYQNLNKYLFQHKSISIPGLGTVCMETIPASIDASTRTALPPFFYFRFDKYFDAPDKEFFAYLAAEQGVQDYEALRVYNEFAYELRDRLNRHDMAEWSGVGTFRKDGDGNVLFESLLKNPFFLQPVSATKVIHADAAHTLLVGDRERTSHEMNNWLSEEPIIAGSRWWLAALITGIAAVLIILFHFSSHGWKAASAGNQQMLQVDK